jgi:hypothetical protein
LTKDYAEKNKRCIINMEAPVVKHFQKNVIFRSCLLEKAERA